MDNEDRNRERRMRRELAKRGLVLRKCRSRTDPQLVGRYQVIDAEKNVVFTPTGDSAMTLVEIEGWVSAGG